MTDQLGEYITLQAQIERLERTLGTLISWKSYVASLKTVHGLLSQLAAGDRDGRRFQWKALKHKRH